MKAGRQKGAGELHSAFGGAWVLLRGFTSCALAGWLYYRLYPPALDMLAQLGAAGALGRLGLQSWLHVLVWVVYVLEVLLAAAAAAALPALILALGIRLDRGLIAALTGSAVGLALLAPSLVFMLWSGYGTLLLWLLRITELTLLAGALVLWTQELALLLRRLTRQH
jgi:hypothetical protein